MKEKVYVLGDSHTEIFQYMEMKSLNDKYSFDVTMVKGATAQGINNPNAKTNALKIFNDKISEIKNKSSKLLFQLGEVDVGFVIWYRAKKYNESILDQLEYSISTYVNFLKGIQKKGFKHINVLSAPLPTIIDGENLGIVGNARREVTASLKERTDLTLIYNSKLEFILSNENINFINMDNDLLDQETNYLLNRFSNKDKNNHHLDIEAYSQATIKKLILK